MGELLIYNATTGYLDLSGQINLFNLGGFCFVPIPLNLTLIKLYLKTKHSLVNLIITDNLKYDHAIPKR